MDGVLWTKAVYHLDFSFRMSIIFSVFIFLQEIDCFFLHFHASLSFQRSEIWLLLRTEEKWKTEKNRNVKNKECSQCWWTLVTKIVTVHIDYWNIFHQLVEMIEYAHCASWLHFHIYIALGVLTNVLLWTLMCCKCYGFPVFRAFDTYLNIK